MSEIIGHPLIKFASVMIFTELNTEPHVPLSTISLYSYKQKPMTRGRSDSLSLTA